MLNMLGKVNSKTITQYTTINREEIELHFNVIVFQYLLFCNFQRKRFGKSCWMAMKYFV